MRRYQTLIWTVFCGCLSIWAASRTWGFEEQNSQVGLNGLLPAVAPDGLTEDDFKTLHDSIDDSWKLWTQETGTFVKEWYEGNYPTVEQQRVALQRVKVKLGTLEKALSDVRYRSIHSKLQSLYSKLAPQVYVAEAMLDTLTLEPQAARQERLGPAFTDLSKATAHLRADLKTYRNGADWLRWAKLDEIEAAKPEAETPAVLQEIAAKLANRETYTPEIRDFVSREPFLRLEDALRAINDAESPQAVAPPADLKAHYGELLQTLSDYRTEPSVANEANIRKILDQIRSKSPDGGVAVANAVGKCYLNYNLRVYASEGFLNRFFAETRREQSPIRDRVLQASVYGYQCSDVTTRIDLVPSEHNARFNLQLRGTIFANTNGVTHQATVHTIGRHGFTASKAVVFDGQSFTLDNSRRVNAYANNQTVSATTKFSRLPLLGRVADNIAVRKANELRPQTNAMAIQKITSQVSTQLEQEAAEQFGNASKQLQTKTYGPLRKYNLYPDVMALSTTDSELRFWGRLMSENEIAGAQAMPVVSIPSDGLVAQIHESLLSHAFDRLGLNGKTMTEDEVRELLEARLSEILDRNVEIPKPAAQPDAAEQSANVLVFAEEDPVRFTIDGGVVTIFIRAGLKRDNGDDIPTQIISVPFQPSLQGDKIVLTRGNVGVKPVVRPPSVAAQVTRAQVMRQKIQSALPEQSFDRNMEVKAQNNKIVRVRVADLAAEGGWLVLTLK